MDINRRSFLKGALATTAVATAAVALPACSTGTDSGTTSGTSGGGDGAQRAREVTPDPITDIGDTKDFDIVIVGAGLAGLSAVEAAARNGASVAVLEQTSEFQVRGVDVGHIGSKWQLENDINIDPLEAARLIFQWSQQSANYDLINT